MNNDDVVCVRRYFYGGGIQSARPGMTVAGRPLRIIDLGETSVPPDLLNEFLREVSHRFTPETYNLFRHNCNTFGMASVRYGGTCQRSWVVQRTSCRCS